jgi:hypothetical protein
MTDWSFPPDIQAQYDRVLAQTRKLQAELGITPMTLDERAMAYERRKVTEARRQQELKILEQQLGQRRPPPTWKV